MTSPTRPTIINVPTQQAEERVEIVSNFSFLILAQIGPEKTERAEWAYAACAAHDGYNKGFNDITKRKLSKI